MKIKKISIKNILAFSSAMIIANSSFAQETPVVRSAEFGIRYMPTFSSIDLQTYNGDIIKGSVAIGNGLGIMLAYNLTKHIGVQAEANYYQVSQNSQDRNLNREINISYFNVPLLLSVNTDKTTRMNINFVLGPQFGVNVLSNIKTTGVENSDTLHAVIKMNQGDVGLAYGAGLEFAINKNHTYLLDLGFRGFYGLVDVNSSNTGANNYNIIAKASRKTFGAYLGLTFLF
jgi:hypothetical protein